MDTTAFIKGLLFVIIMLFLIVPPGDALRVMLSDANKKKPSTSDFILKEWVPVTIGIALLFLYLFFFTLKDLPAQDWYVPNLIFALTSLYFSITILILVLLRIRYATSQPSE